jgi:hypothetical protein
MPLIRGHHSFDDHYTQIPNDWLRDVRLTFKARGVLALIMSHTAGWSLSIASLAARNLEGKDALRSAIKELEDIGYLLRTQENDGGRFGETVWVTQDPAGLPSSGLPSSGFPSSDNPTPKKNIVKEEQIKETNMPKHSETEDLFNEFWNAYPRKIDKAKAFRAFKSALKRTKFEDILAGVLAYRSDPKRDPDFTKYPATWLNNDSWENAAALPEAFVSQRREKELEHSDKVLQELRELEAQAAPPPKCQHDNNPALCKICLRELS